MFLRIGDKAINLNRITKVELATKFSNPDTYKADDGIRIYFGPDDVLSFAFGTPEGKALYWLFTDADCKPRVQNHTHFVGSTGFVDLVAAFNSRDESEPEERPW